LLQGAVEVVAVAPHPALNQRWWKGDGSLLDGPGFINEGAKTLPSREEHAFEFVLRAPNRPPGASNPRWQFQPTASWADGGNPARTDQPDKPLTDHFLVAATFPKSVKRVTIRAGIASGAWEAIAECDGRGGLSTSRSHGATEWSVSFGEPVETKEGELVMHVSHTRPDDWETRIVAINARGEEVRGNRSSTRNEQTAVRFSNVALADVKEFRLQARRYDWSEVADIPLEPDGQ
jgi:hypothetical protein